MIEDIKKILEYAITAPSGDNCQPWRFSYTEGLLDVFNDPNSDTSLYSWGQRASLVSHGALLQNIILASLELGYEAKIQFFPKQEDLNYVARVTFINLNNKRNEGVISNITKRVTNRKIYEKKKLAD